MWQDLKEGNTNELAMEAPDLSSETPSEEDPSPGISVTPFRPHESNDIAEDPEKISISRAAAGFQRPSSKHDVGWRRIVRHFTPSWFTVCMGTGICSILLRGLPYNGRWLYWLSVIVFALNVVLFVAFNIISILRYTLYPEIWPMMIRHPNQVLFLGAYPMALSTIVNMVAYVCVPVWGSWAIQFAWGLWIFNVIISVAVHFTIPFIIMSQTKHASPSTMTALSLFPFVTTVVTSGSGAILADILPNAQHALWTIIVSYILWGTSMPFAMIIMVGYFQRLAVHKLPPREVIVSCFLPVGPPGQGGFAIFLLGRVSMRVFLETNSLHPLAGPFLYIFGFATALILWGFGLVWLFFAIASIYKAKSFPFNMGWWGFTFPIGVFITSTNLLGKELPSKFFNVVGTIMSICVILLWIVVAIGTLKGAISGKLFSAPDLKDLERKEEQQQEDAGKLA